VDAERRNPQMRRHLELQAGDVSEVLDNLTSLVGSMFDAMISACRNNPVTHLLDAVDIQRYHSDALPKTTTGTEKNRQ
jgi:hypothetical protein